MDLFDETSEISQLQEYLHSCGALALDAKVSAVAKAGEGNMNVVLRIKHSQGSVILKQARPYVHKYPTIPAPIGRIWVESAYYEATASLDKLRKYMPRILHKDRNNFLLLMEDLGDLHDMTIQYQADQKLDSSTIEALIDYLLALHRALPLSDIEAFPKNLDLRKLNYEHLFVYPYREDNGLDLDGITPGLKEIALSICRDTFLKKEAEKLGDIYLSSGSSLLHGDFYPGSWFVRDHDVMILDPEFAYCGHPEFDLGVMVGHLYLMNAPQEKIDLARDRYYEGHPLDTQLVDRFAGMEIIRRLIGLAQLPLDLSLASKKRLIEEARILMTQSR